MEHATVTAIDSVVADAAGQAIIDGAAAVENLTFTHATTGVKVSGPPPVIADGPASAVLNRAELAAAVAFAVRAVEKRSCIPVSAAAGIGASRQ